MVFCFLSELKSKESAGICHALQNLHHSGISVLKNMFPEDPSILYCRAWSHIPSLRERNSNMVLSSNPLLLLHQTQVLLIKSNNDSPFCILFVPIPAFLISASVAGMSVEVAFAGLQMLFEFLSISSIFFLASRHIILPALFPKWISPP